MITHEADHKGKAIERLAQQYKNSPQLMGVINAIADMFQLTEDAIYEMYGRLDIDASEGQQLDGIGGIVGIERQGYADATYRLLIKGKIAENTSTGTPEDIIQIYNILTSGTTAYIGELFPAKIFITNNGSIPAGLEFLVEQMTNNSTAAGVGLDYIGYHNGGDAFSFAGGDGKGFGDTTDANIGGEFAKVWV